MNTAPPAMPVSSTTASRTHHSGETPSSSERGAASVAPAVVAAVPVLRSAAAVVDGSSDGGGTDPIPLGVAPGAATVNENEPSTGCPSGETTFQRTVTFPGGSVPTGCFTTTSVALAGPVPAFFPSAPVTVTVGCVGAPLNVNETAVIAFHAVLFGAGFVARR